MILLIGDGYSSTSLSTHDVSEYTHDAPAAPWWHYRYDQDGYSGDHPGTYYGDITTICVEVLWGLREKRLRYDIPHQ